MYLIQNYGGVKAGFIRYLFYHHSVKDESAH